VPPKLSSYIAFGIFHSISTDVGDQELAVGRGILTIDEVDHDLAHLDPFTIRVTPKAEGSPTYKVLVTFSHHTFTRSFEEGVDNEAYRHVEDGETRCFCPDRYLSSQALPILIGRAVGGRAYFSQSRNFMLLDQPLGGPPYAIFFKLSRSKGLKGIDARMFVVSAYEKPNLPPPNRLPAISFATLVSKTVRGEPVVRPKK
jgi:hypothetical protein